MTAIHELERALAARPSTLVLLTPRVGRLRAAGTRRGRRAVVAHPVGRVLRSDRDVGLPAAGGLRPDVQGHHARPALVAFAINVAAVVYLLVSKRLFGLRGGRRAYDAERRGEQLLDVERAAARRRGLVERLAGRARRRAPGPASSRSRTPRGTRRCPVPAGRRGTAPARRRPGWGTRRGSPARRRPRPTAPSRRSPAAPRPRCARRR